METEQEELEQLEQEQEQELNNPTPPKSDNVSDILTSKEFAHTVDTLIEEKLKLADTVEDEEEPEEEPEEEKSFGLFPALLIGGVVVSFIASVFLQNRPNIDHEATHEINHG